MAAESLGLKNSDREFLRSSFRLYQAQKIFSSLPSSAQNLRVTPGVEQQLRSRFCRFIGKQPIFRAGMFFASV